MANFISCDTAGYSVDTILASMFSELDSDTRVAGFRIINKTGTTFEYLSDCSSYDSWEELFKMALEIDTNGYAALRVVISDDANSMAACDEHDPMANLIRRSFVKLADDSVALLLFESSGD